MGIIMTGKPLRERQENDFYPTPYECVRESLKQLSLVPTDVLDPGAGSGVWGIEARKMWPHAYISGIEIDRTFAKPEAYDHWYVGDYLDPDISGHSYDLIIGNPPYNKAEKFIRKSMSLLKPNGQVFFLLRLAFLEGQKRTATLWKELWLKHTYVLGRRPSFTGNQKTDATAYAMFLFQKGHTEIPRLSWLDWSYDSDRLEVPIIRIEDVEQLVMF